jgi:6,7-dimethyl-8-ribityllumazine synthase
MAQRTQSGAEPAAPKGAVGAHVLVIEAPYYAAISESLAEGAIAVLAEGGATFERVNVPGALEIPQALLFACQNRPTTSRAKTFDGAVVLGCVIRGETSHYDIVCNNANHWLMHVAVEHAMPVGNGVLTVESEAQALARCAGGKNNKGGEAARACLQLIALKRHLRGWE